jgi:hypothetical protein
MVIDRRRPGADRRLDRTGPPGEGHQDGPRPVGDTRPRDGPPDRPLAARSTGTGPALRCATRSGSVADLLGGRFGRTVATRCGHVPVRPSSADVPAWSCTAAARPAG